MYQLDFNNAGPSPEKTAVAPPPDRSDIFRLCDLPIDAYAKGHTSSVTEPLRRTELQTQPLLRRSSAGGTHTPHSSASHLFRRMLDEHLRKLDRERR